MTKTQDTFVYPGQLAAGRAPFAIRTILGSCVAVVLLDREAGVLGLCHYLLDRPTGQAHPGLKYGVHAIPSLIREVLICGASQQALVAHVYGGANVSEKLALFHQEIGRSNIDIARQILSEFSIPVIHQDTGGNVGRNIRVTTQDYAVTCREVGAEVPERRGSRAPVQPQPVRERATVLIVDDSQTARAVLERALARHQGIQIVGSAADAFDARDKIVQLNPDVVLLDIEMPKMNGVDFLEKVMRHNPLPVIMVSSLNPDGRAARRALELGAIEFVQKPSQYDPALLRDLSETLPQKILAAATAKNQLKKGPRAQSPVPTISKGSNPKSNQGIDLICVSGNVGCLPSLEIILSSLEDDSPPVALAISIVSSIPSALIEKLKTKAKLDLILVDRPVTMGRGKVYFTDSNHHAHIENGPGGTLVIRPGSGMPVQGQRPSGDVLMMGASAARNGSICGILLGGFGKDGVRGLATINETGGFTLVEDPATAAFPYTVLTALEEGIAERATTAEAMASAIFERRSAVGA